MRSVEALNTTLIAAAAPPEGPPQAIPSVSATTTFHCVDVDGTEIFYREAGPRDAPTVLLLHGFPSSSRQYSPLLPLLADRYRVIAPDYPGFGQSDAPPPSRYGYTFDNLARTIEGLIERLGIGRYALFLQDYGGPVGFRMPQRSPRRSGLRTSCRSSPRCDRRRRTPSRICAGRSTASWKLSR